MNNIPRMVNCTMDRPMGSVHPSNGTVYPINYGYVNNLIGGDGEEQDVYVLGVNRPIKKGRFKVISVIHRINDNEDKWVVCPENKSFSKKEIIKQTYFMERWFKSEIYMLDNNQSLQEDVGTQEYVQELLGHAPYDKIFLSSDWHLFKKEVTPPFTKESSLDMKKYIFKYNMKVGRNDILIYLGDLAHKKCNTEHYTKLKSFLNKLNGIKILIKGNHDFQSDDFYLSCGFNFVFDKLEFDNIIFTHKPVPLKMYPNCKLNIHGHIHQSVDYYDSEKKNHIKIFSPNHELYSLKYLLDHRKDLQKDNIDLMTDSNKKFLESRSDVIKRYQKCVDDFFKKNPHYKKLSNMEKYLYQDKITLEFFHTYFANDEQMMHWQLHTVNNKQLFMSFIRNSEDPADFSHSTVLNKDLNLLIDLFPELIKEKSNIIPVIYSLKKHKWSFATSEQRPGYKFDQIGYMRHIYNNRGNM